MKIAGLNKLTLIDYPGKVAAIIFTQGCNFNCSYCHNSGLIPLKGDNIVTEEEVLEYLTKRKNILDGVVISGGEPLIQKDIDIFIKKIKDLGLKIKLDTNGFNPNKLKALLDGKLIDYVAMDIKSSFDNYHLITGIKETNKIKASINILLESKIDYEFRTTIIKEYHDIDEIRKILSYIGSKPKYYLQNYQDNETVLNRDLHSFSESELKEIERLLKKDYPNVIMRGI